ncbi:hypothetical protein [Thiohalocapsa sp. ML1]|uniref:hypothetical protein n=1 Tax=Thiohalocapsa sp. ML1 TaxID=1431688 RepID=UPI0007321D12|nr:hypothetical protein [Thiohalocapsa sp. ML1]
MATRTVRLDDEAETTLERLRCITGWSISQVISEVISEVLKRGLAAYETQALAETSRRPYDIYRALGLGPGGYAAAPARGAKSAVSAAIRRSN